MGRNKKKQYEEMFDVSVVLYWVLSSDIRTGVVVEEIEKIGKFYEYLACALCGGRRDGKENKQ